MKISRYGFIFIGAGYDPIKQIRFDSTQFVSIIYGVENLELACKAAKSLVSEGVQVIELCGAFNTEMVDSIISAIDGTIPVGHITFSEKEQSKLTKILQQ